ncbi:FkbM family methyltransferase [Clostridium botulinum]|nr:FkbM family methyltransferase [Clostridium botulinum]
MSQLVDKENTLIKVLRNGKKNIIFGSGAIGSLFSKCLNDLNIPVYCFLVNDNHRVESTHLSIPIYTVSELSVSEEECNIFVAVRSINSNIMNPIKEKMSNNLIYIDYVKDLLLLKKLYYINYFKKNNIDINNEIINFKGLKIMNPFLKDMDYCLAVLVEMSDIILPEIMSDYSQIDEGNYEYGDVKLIEDDVVFDCGANVGLFSAVAAFKKCKVYAFEPFIETQVYLKETANLYSGLINIVPMALSNKIGISKFNILKNYIGGNSILDTELGEEDYTTEVKINTIDNFVKENNIVKVDFIKADIEGAERFMIMGAKETLKYHAPKISVCTYHIKDDPQVIEKLIKEANPNYKIEHKWKKLYAYVPKGIN